MKSRIISILRYDWVLNKQKAFQATGILFAVYIALTLVYFYTKHICELDNYGQLPTAMSAFIFTFFSYAQLAGVLIVTQLLHQKFVNPRSSTTYLSLPGNSKEKFIVMIGEYAIVFIAIWVLYVIIFYLSMGIFKLNAPSLDWSQNAFNNFIPTKGATSVLFDFNNAIYKLDQEESEYCTAASSLLKAALYFGYIWSLTKWAYYIVLNMSLRSNGQAKSILCFIATGIVLGIIAVIAFISTAMHTFGDLDVNVLADNVHHSFTVLAYILTGLCYLTPVYVIALLAIFYRQICRKQAK